MRTEWDIPDGLTSGGKIPDFFQKAAMGKDLLELDHGLTATEIYREVFERVGWILRVEIESAQVAAKAETEKSSRRV